MNHTWSERKIETTIGGEESVAVIRQPIALFLSDRATTLNRLRYGLEWFVCRKRGGGCWELMKRLQ
jgi:hypothetical protein